jgi:hypothetical protein
MQENYLKIHGASVLALTLPSIAQTKGILFLLIIVDTVRSRGGKRRPYSLPFTLRMREENNFLLRRMSQMP